MLKAIARIVRTPDLLRKIAFTLALIAVYRMGAFVPAPGVDYPAVQQCLAAGNAQGGLYSFVNMFSGGALLRAALQNRAAGGGWQLASSGAVGGSVV